MITVIQGPTGSGKTLKMSWLLKSYYKQGLKIYTNQPFWFDKESTGTGVYRWHNIEEVYNAKNGVIAIDEAQKLFEARRWNNFPLSFSDKIGQHRKHLLDIITTTQDLSHIDFKIRSNIHQLYTCKSYFRFPKNERKKPILQWIGVIHQKRDFSLGENRTVWLTGGKMRWYFVSKFWTKKYYDTYQDIDLEKYVCRIKYEKKVGQKKGKWLGRIYSRDLVNSGKAKL